MDAPTPFIVPRLNVNDDTVLLVKWSVPQHAVVSAGQVVCEMETSKATSEVVIGHAGVLVQTIQPPSRVAVGDEIGVVGPSAESVAAYLSARTASPAASGPVQATPRASVLAEQAGVSIEEVAASGVRGTVKESDVRRYVESRGSAAAPAVSRALPAGLEAYVTPAGRLSAVETAVAASLKRSIDHLIQTSVDADCDLANAQALMQTLLASGHMVSVLHVIVAAVGRALGKHPRLMSVAHEGDVYQYRSVDVAFVARTSDGRLYTPVIRGVDKADLSLIATTAQGLSLRVMRGTLSAADLEGGCFTVSHVAVAGTTRVAALPSFGQSAVLGVSAERKALRLVNGAVVERAVVTLTLTYDHTLCDGTYAASFLADVVAAVAQMTKSPNDQMTR